MLESTDYEVSQRAFVHSFMIPSCPAEPASIVEDFKESPDSEDIKPSFPQTPHAEWSLHFRVDIYVSDDGPGKQHEAVHYLPTLSQLQLG